MRALELRIPPTIVCLVIGIAMWLAARATPALSFESPGLRWLAGALVLVGFVIVALAVAGLRRAHTTLNPTHPGKSAVLVVSGIYRRTRNPMYLGLLAFVAGWALVLDNALALLGVPILMAYLTWFQIIPEERALAERFGTEFHTYQSRVRRWL